MRRQLGALGLAALLLASCTRERTQIMLRVETDMTQGPDGTLGAIRVRVWSEGETEPEHDQVYVLGDDVRLPAELALVPRQEREGLVEIEVEARAPDGTVLFAKPARARYEPERTLLLTVVLADRCRVETARQCAEGQSCGPTGCEVDLRSSLPVYGPDGGGTTTDGGPMPCPDRCGDECVDTLSDLEHCGGCGNACTAPENADPTCTVGACGYTCLEGFHECSGACLSMDAVESCGDSCSACPAPATSGVAACESRACTVVCDPGFMASGSDCVPGPNVDPPRPITPRSLGRVASTRPTFRWALAPGTDGALVQLCEDPACATVVGTRWAGGGATSLTWSDEIVPPASSSRRLYFRLFGRSGPATGASPSATWSFALPARSADADATLGVIYDVEGDGFADLAVGSLADRVALYRGGDAGLTDTGRELSQTAGSELGFALAAAGDVNGDGYGDLVVGAPGIRRAYVYLGGASGLGTSPITLVGGAGSDFGRAVARAGDVDGDGYGDVMVGAPGAGTVSIFLGGSSLDTTADVVLSGPAAGGFGQALTPLDDVDLDGFGDVAVGAPGEGAVYVFRGAASPAAARDAAEADQRLEGSAVESFGGSLAGGLDVDGDGRGDLLVGAPTAAVGADGVHLFLGTAAGVATEAANQWRYPVGAPSSTELAAALAPAGDVNRDGFDDWLVGAPGAASAFVYRGSVAAGESDPSGRFMPAAASRFGAAVACPGDIDGDGYDDSVVGDPGARTVRVYRHGAGGIDEVGVPLTGTTTGFGASLAR